METCLIRVDIKTKEKLDFYKDRYMSHCRGHISYSDIVTHTIKRVERLEDKVLRMPWRYKILHKWVMSGDTDALLTMLREEVARISAVDPNDPHINIDHSPIDDRLAFLLSVSDSF